MSSGMAAVVTQSSAALSVDALVARFRTHQAKSGVIGLGYVGLPLVRAISGQGFDTVGFDIDRAKIAVLNAGGSYIRHIPAETIAGLLKSKKFAATDDFARLREVDAILLCVPT